MPRNQQEAAFHSGRLARQQAVRLSGRLPGDPVRTELRAGWDISQPMGQNPRQL